MTYYDNIAEGYNELHGEEQKKKARIILKCIKIKSTDYLLDVGCGTGITTELFNCKKVGIDPSKKLLEQASFPTKRAPAENIPFNNKTFDIIISITAIQNFTDLKKAIAEMIRVGKPDCIYAVSCLKKSSKAKEIEKLLKSNFNIKNKIDEEKDTIYIMEKKEIR